MSELLNDSEVRKFSVKVHSWDIDTEMESDLLRGIRTDNALGSKTIDAFSSANLDYSHCNSLPSPFHALSSWFEQWMIETMEHTYSTLPVLWPFIVNCVIHPPFQTPLYTDSTSVPTTIVRRHKLVSYVQQRDQIIQHGYMWELP